MFLLCEADGFSFRKQCRLHVMWVPVTTAWYALGLRMEVAVNALNKQPRTRDKGWSSSCGGGLGLATFYRK
jgi:hypothetical protein